MGFKTEKELEDYLTDSGQWAYKRKNNPLIPFPRHIQAVLLKVMIL